MSEDNSSIQRKIQRHGSENQYYRMTLPPEFAEGKEEVHMKIADNTLIVQDTSEENSKELTIDIENFRSAGKLDLQLILEILPSWAMAGYDRINIKRPENQDEKDQLNNFLKSTQNRPFLEWNKQKFCLEMEEYAYEDFVKDVEDFLDLHFMDTLKGINKLEYLDRDFEQEFLKHDSWQNEDIPHSIIHDDEEEIDIFWSLTSKNAAEIFQSLDTEEYPRAVGKIHVANKLERTVDHSFACLALLRDLYERSDSETELESVTRFRNHIRDVFLNPEFNKEVTDIGKKCFSGDVDIDDVTNSLDVQDP